MEQHTPKDHQNHEPGEPCGCWLGEGEAIVCRGCGAAYLPFNVKHFPRWHCYDCEALVWMQESGMSPAAFFMQEEPL